MLAVADSVSESSDQLSTENNFPQFSSSDSMATAQDSPKQSTRSLQISLSTSLASIALFVVFIGLATACMLTCTKFRKRRKERALASEVHQANHESMPPIYETVNSETPEEPHSNNFETHVDTITSDDPEGAYYENVHSQETKSCHNSSTRIDTAANVAYMTSSEIPMQNNNSYQAVCTINH